MIWIYIVVFFYLKRLEGNYYMHLSHANTVPLTSVIDSCSVSCVVFAFCDWFVVYLLCCVWLLWLICCLLSVLCSPFVSDLWSVWCVVFAFCHWFVVCFLCCVRLLNATRSILFLDAFVLLVFALGHTDSGLFHRQTSLTAVQLLVQYPSFVAPACAVRCLATSGCGHFVFLPSTKWCQLYKDGSPTLPLPQCGGEQRCYTKIA